MSADVTDTAPAPDAGTAPERHYGFSALLSGFARMWRGWRVIVPVVLLNALAQALLVLPDPVPGRSWSFLLLAVVSFLVLAFAMALVTSSALSAAVGPVTWGRVVDRLAQHGGAFMAWFALVLAAIAVGLVLWVVPGWLVAMLTVYVLLAALDGRGRGALGADLRAIGSRWGRWLITALLMGVVVAVSWLLAAFSAFFITGAISAFITWTWFGLLASWFQTTWACLYRSTPAGRG